MTCRSSGGCPRPGLPGRRRATGSPCGGRSPEILTALAEAREGEPFELEVELGGVPDEVARWLNPVVCRILRCD